MTIHTFTESVKKGSVGESVIRAHFESKGWTCTPAALLEQKSVGIDFTLSKGDRNYGLEVKTEYSAEKTGNVFWEMEVSGKPGWTQKYAEDSKILICTLLPYSRVIYLYFAKSLPKITQYIRDNFENSKRTVYNTSGVQGRTLNAWGYLLPLPHLAKFSKKYKI